jgi:hypothetical protein
MKSKPLYRRVSFLQVFGISILMVAVSCSALGHKQNTHQYIVREAWALLQSQGIHVGPYATFVGTTEHDDNGNLTTPRVVGGAYNEDGADFVFKHGIPNSPFEAWSGAFTSVTHFWRIGDAQLNAWDEYGTW